MSLITSQLGFRARPILGILHPRTQVSPCSPYGGPGFTEAVQGRELPSCAPNLFSFGWIPNQKISRVTWKAQVEVCQIDFMSFLQAILEKYTSRHWGGWVPARWLAWQCDTLFFFLTPGGTWLPSPHPALPGSLVKAFNFCYRKTIYPLVPCSLNKNHFQLNQ